jgi:hypothetical protein
LTARNSFRCTCTRMKTTKSICVAANSCQNPVVVSDVLRGLIPGGQTGFYQATNSTLQAVQQPATAPPPPTQQLHQTGSPYNLQGYGTQSGATTPVGLQNFGSQVASTLVLRSSRLSSLAVVYPPLRQGISGWDISVVRESLRALKIHSTAAIRKMCTDNLPFFNCKWGATWKKN